MTSDHDLAILGLTLLYSSSLRGEGDEDDGKARKDRRKTVDAGFFGRRGLWRRKRKMPVGALHRPWQPFHSGLYSWRARESVRRSLPPALPPRVDKLSQQVAASLSGLCQRDFYNPIHQFLITITQHPRDGDSIPLARRDVIPQNPRIE